MDAHNRAAGLRSTNDIKQCRDTNKQCWVIKAHITYISHGNGYFCFWLKCVPAHGNAIQTLSCLLSWAGLFDWPQGMIGNYTCYYPVQPLRGATAILSDQCSNMQRQSVTRRVVFNILQTSFTLTKQLLLPFTPAGMCTQRPL